MGQVPEVLGGAISPESIWSPLVNDTGTLSSNWTRSDITWQALLVSEKIIVALTCTQPNHWQLSRLTE